MPYSPIAFHWFSVSWVSGVVFELISLIIARTLDLICPVYTIETAARSDVIDEPNTLPVFVLIDVSARINSRYLSIGRFAVYVCNVAQLQIGDDFHSL